MLDTRQPIRSVTIGERYPTTYRFQDGTLIGLTILSGADVDERSLPIMELAFRPMSRRSKLTVLVIEEEEA